MPDRIAKRMQYLEKLDAGHRRAGAMPHFERLRQVPPATGKFLALLASGAPAGNFIELGTSGGYSTMWLSLAARESGRRITTFEKSESKIRLARETFEAAGIDDIVDLVPGDALEHLVECDGVAFCFLDLEKSIYVQCYDIVVPRLAPGGLLVADNIISHREEVAPLVRRALKDERVDALIVPIGSGELVCRRF
jgi:predicted O-methyltransferase YrrM